MRVYVQVFNLTVVLFPFLAFMYVGMYVSLIFLFVCFVYFCFLCLFACLFCLYSFFRMTSFSWGLFVPLFCYVIILYIWISF